MLYFGSYIRLPTVHILFRCSQTVGGMVFPRHRSRSPLLRVPLSPPPSTLSGAMTTATAAKLYRKVSPVSHDGVTHKSHGNSAGRVVSHTGTGSVALGLHAHYLPLPSRTNESGGVGRKLYDFNSFAYLSASLMQNSKFNFFETSDESYIIDLEPPQTAHRPLERSTSTGLNGGSHVPTTRNGMLARSIHRHSVDTGGHCSVHSEDGVESSLVALVKALLVRHKHAMSNSA